MVLEFILVLLQQMNHGFVLNVKLLIHKKEIDVKNVKLLNQMYVHEYCDRREETIFCLKTFRLFENLFLKARQELIGRVFSAMDLDSDNRVSWDELCAFLDKQFGLSVKKDGTQKKEKKSEKCFKAFLSGCKSQEISKK